MLGLSVKDLLIKLLAIADTILPYLGSLSSIIALTIAIYLLYRFRRMLSEFLFLQRGPRLIEQLRQHASNISKYLADFDRNLYQLKEELAVCDANLRNLKPKVKGDVKSTIKKLIKMINRQKKGASADSKDAIWDIYIELSAVVTELINLQQDKKGAAIWQIIRSGHR